MHFRHKSHVDDIHLGLLYQRRAASSDTTLRRETVPEKGRLYQRNRHDAKRDQPQANVQQLLDFICLGLLWMVTTMPALGHGRDDMGPGRVTEAGLEP